MVTPEPLTAACGKRGGHVEPLTAACGSEWVNTLEIANSNDIVLILKNKTYETKMEELLHT